MKKLSMMAGRALLVCLATLAFLASATPSATPAGGEDLMTFAHGALLLRIEAPAAARVSDEQGVQAIDGSPQVYVLTRPVDAEHTRVALVYELPTPTVFTHFAVPQVLETPSPLQTFVREVVVSGSASSPDQGFEKLASATLVAHRQRGQSTVLTLHQQLPVRWVRVELGGGLEVPQPARPVSLEFSELVAYGRHETLPDPRDFAGGWRGRGLDMALRQHGGVVSGCYDKGGGRLQGTVDGRVLRATGQAQSNAVPSAFIASMRDDGSMVLMRSTNGAPFRPFAGARAAGAGAPCPDTTAPALGCGSVIHGIRFDFDAAVLRAESAPLLAALADGLKLQAGQRVRIQGHTSSEGSAGHNMDLSRRRAQAVVDDLVRRGLDPARLGAEGLGPSRPVAPNDDENGRSLNRRVEVHCAS